MSFLFDQGLCNTIQQNVIDLLNENVKQITNSVNSPRAMGESIPSFLKERFQSCVPTGIIQKFENNFSLRSMANFAFHDSEEKYYMFNCITHNLNTHFNCPNLTSVERLKEVYKDGTVYFVILMIEYISDQNGNLIFKNCLLLPIERLDWSCISIGALGKGELQISNSNMIRIFPGTRKEWMLEFCDRLDSFYPRQIQKLNKNALKVAETRTYWENQPD
jgi:hypothetical protein